MLLPLTIVCVVLLPLTIVCVVLLPLTIVCVVLLLLTIVCVVLLPLIIVCVVLLPLTIVCVVLLPLTIVCVVLLPPAIFCSAAEQIWRRGLLNYDSSPALDSPPKSNQLSEVYSNTAAVAQLPAAAAAGSTDVAECQASAEDPAACTALRAGDSGGGSDVSVRSGSGPSSIAPRQKWGPPARYPPEKPVIFLGTENPLVRHILIVHPQRQVKA